MHSQVERAVSLA